MDYIHLDLQDCQHDINVVANIVCGKVYHTKQTVIIENADFQQNERPAIRVYKSIELITFKPCIFVGDLDGIVPTESTNIAVLKEYEGKSLIYYFTVTLPQRKLLSITTKATQDAK